MRTAVKLSTGSAQHELRFWNRVDAGCHENNPEVAQKLGRGNDLLPHFIVFPSCSAIWGEPKLPSPPSRRLGFNSVCQILCPVDVCTGLCSSTQRVDRAAPMLDHPNPAQM